ncbi:MAG: GHKL domain-containing protein [Oscillospiraceae bacterium]|nr:GHKL domain-containing protein [Oscillospiraceae bacterium]
MEFTIIDIIHGMLMYAPAYIVTKILTRDFRSYLKESIYLVVAILLHTIVSDIIPVVFFLRIELRILLYLVPYILLFTYLFRIKRYPYKKCFIIMLGALLITPIVNLLLFLIVNTISPVYLERINNITLQAPLYIILQSIPFLLIMIISSALAALFFAKFSSRLQERVYQSKKAQTILSTISVAIIAFMAISTAIMRYQYEFMDFITSWELFFAFGFSIVVFVSFSFYMKSEREKTARQQKETEQKAMQQYTEQVEQQQVIVQKFKHDHKNILLSIEGYLETEDIAGLKEYFSTQIKTADDAITQSDFSLYRLSNIKIPEIKATLINKLLAAGSAGIDVNIEIIGEIEHVSIRSVSLVRMLSIILDNAIEALAELQSGTLSVACYKEEYAVVFVVQNTCRADLPPLSQLKRANYSNKGEGRGFGLSNLTELVSEYRNIILHTNITEGNFIQKLSIGKGEV